MNMFIKMPKIIENAKESIFQASKEELISNPSSFSMRKVAKKTHLAVGTLYRYFPDKMNLIAEVLLDDWNEVYKEKEEALKSIKDFQEILSLIQELLSQFKKKYEGLFSLNKKYEGIHDFFRLHLVLVQQLKKLFQSGLETLNMPKNDQRDEMIVEMILLQIRNPNISVENLNHMIAKLI